MYLVVQRQRVARAAGDGHDADGAAADDVGQREGGEFEASRVGHDEGPVDFEGGGAFGGMDDGCVFIRSVRLGNPASQSKARDSLTGLPVLAAAPAPQVALEPPRRGRLFLFLLLLLRDGDGVRVLERGELASPGLALVQRVGRHRGQHP